MQALIERQAELSHEEISRYSRHIIMPEVGIEGQRNLKAAGRFVYIDRVKGNPNFLQSIPRTLHNVRANLSKYPQLHRLLKHLSPYVPEWQ